MSPTRFPARMAAIPASSDRRVTSISRAASSDTSPTGAVKAASPCQPDTTAPQSMATTSPSSRTRSPGIPWTTTSLGEAQITAG